MSSAMPTVMNEDRWTATGFSSAAAIIFAALVALLYTDIKPHINWLCHLEKKKDIYSVSLHVPKHNIHILQCKIAGSLNKRCILHLTLLVWDQLLIMLQYSLCLCCGYRKDFASTSDLSQQSCGGSSADP